MKKKKGNRNLQIQGDFTDISDAVCEPCLGPDFNKLTVKNSSMRQLGEILTSTRYLVILRNDCFFRYGNT